MIDEFVDALGETQSVSSQVTAILDNQPIQKG